MTKIENGIILNGNVYEAVERECPICEECALYDRCNECIDEICKGLRYECDKSFIFRLHQPMVDKNNEE